MEVYGYSHRVMKWGLGWSMMLNLFGGGGWMWCPKLTRYWFALVANYVYLQIQVDRS